MADEEKKKCYPTYRCMRCASTFFKVDKPATADDLAAFALNPPTVIAVRDVYRTTVHTCDDSGSGLANIVGITPEDIVEELITPPANPNESDEGLN